MRCRMVLRMVGPLMLTLSLVFMLTTVLVFSGYSIGRLPPDVELRLDDSRKVKMGPGCHTRVPEIMITGFPKCGTLALSVYMDMHPEIYLYPEEPKYFSSYYKNFEKGPNWYLSQFPCNISKRLLLERASEVSSDEVAMRRIANTNKNVKLIFVVKDPVIRVISHYTMEVNLFKMKQPPFEDVLQYPNGSINLGERIMGQSRYFISMVKWLKYFKRSQIHIVDGEELIKYPIPELLKLEQFLNVRKFFEPKHFQFDKQKGFYCMMHPARGGPRKECLRADKGIKHIDVQKDFKKKLYGAFKNENDAFFQLVNRKFNWIYKD